MAIPAWMVGAGGGFLVGGPVGAVIGGAGSHFLFKDKLVTQPVVVTHDGPGGATVVAPIGPEVPVAATPGGGIIPLDVLSPADVDYQPFPPAYAPVPFVPQLQLEGVLSDLWGQLPLRTLAGAAAVIAGLVYLGRRR